MGIFDKLKKKFLSQEDRINQAHLRNFFIIAVAGVDVGNVSEKDYYFIESLGQKLNLSKTLIYEVFNTGSEIGIHLPKYQFEKNENIFDYFLFLHRNGEVTTNEKKAFQMVLLSVTNLKRESADKIYDEISEIIFSRSTIDGLTHDAIGQAITMETYFL